jgi:hypothetical protein
MPSTMVAARMETSDQTMTARPATVRATPTRIGPTVARFVAKGHEQADGTTPQQANPDQG